MPSESSLKIHVEGPPQRAEVLYIRTVGQVAEKLASLLAQITRSEGRDAKLEWALTDVQRGSAVFVVNGVAHPQLSPEVEEGVAQSVINKTVEVFEYFERSDAASLIRSTPPAFLRYSGVEIIRDLGNLHSQARITLAAQDREVMISKSSAVRAKELLDRSFLSFGSIEGRIETVSIHESPSYFTLFQILDGSGVKCRAEQDLIDIASRNLGKRVQVLGDLRRRFDGHVDAMSASSIYIFPDRSQLPQVKDIRGIFAEEHR